MRVRCRDVSVRLLLWRGGEEDTWWDEHFNAEDCKYYLLVFCFFSMVLVKPN